LHASESNGSEEGISAVRQTKIRQINSLVLSFSLMQAVVGDEGKVVLKSSLWVALAGRMAIVC
jgi:hypothetical protein